MPSGRRENSRRPRWQERSRSTAAMRTCEWAETVSLLLQSVTYVAIARCANVPYRHLRLTDRRRVTASGSCCRPHWAWGSPCLSHPPPYTLTAGRFHRTARQRYITTLRNRFRLPVVTVVYRNHLVTDACIQYETTEHHGRTKAFQKTHKEQVKVCCSAIETCLQL